MASSADSPPDVDLSGRTLGDYRLLRRLGRGAMAEVYLSQQTSLSRSVAVKILRPELASDENYVRRFQQEARAVASLVHPSIVQVYEVGCVDGLQFIVQEYVQGQNLRQWLDRQGTVDAPAALTILRQIAAALDRAARTGIVHRDIKPENILLSREGAVKVADFGLARRFGAEELSLTRPDVTLGTPLYMSPEQVMGRPLDPRSDLYSLGVTAYQMLAGRLPFNADTPLAVAMQHLHAQPDRLENLRPDLPEGLCRIVHRLLSKQPEDRFASPRDLLKELRSLPLAAETADDFADLDDVHESGLLAATVRSAATQRLEAAMQTAALEKLHQRNAIRGWAAAGVFALAVGVLAGWLVRDRYLLAEARPDPLPTFNTAAEQLRFARSAAQPQQKEAALLTLLQRFPRAQAEGQQAEQELALLYLQQHRYAEALTIFERFAQQAEILPEYRAFGLAGSFVVLTIEGRSAEADRVLPELLTLREHLVRTPSGPLPQLFAWALERHALQNRQTIAAQWEEFLDELDEEPPPESAANATNN